MRATSKNADLTPLFRPKSVAIIGASDKNPWSRLVVGTLDRIKFQGPVHLVNPRSAIVLGRPAAPSCVAIGEPVDAAFLAVPTLAIFDALHDMAAAGIRYGAIVSSGFAEGGEDGAQMQRNLSALATELGITILGPNSLGFINYRDRVALSAIPMNREPIDDGKVGIVSQSGATAAMLLRFAEQQGVGLSYAVALGNEAIVDLASVMEFLIGDEQTRSIAVFAESIRDTGAFVRAALSARRARKPIVILKVGRGELAARTAQAHTGSLVGDDKAFDAVCRQFGIIRVDSLEQLVLTTDFIGKVGPLPGKGLAIASISGGACEMIADRGQDEGIVFADFAPQTVARIEKILPDFAVAQNPLDVTGVVQANPILFRDAVAACAEDPGVDLVAAIFEAPTSTAGSSNATVQGILCALGEAMSVAPVPTFILTQTVSPISVYGQASLKAAGIPFAMTGLDHGASAIGAAYRWSAWLRDDDPASAEEIVTLTASRPTSEKGALAYLAEAGVPTISTVLARTREEAVAHAKAIGGAVVLKILSPDIAHKTEVGGVKLDLYGDEAIGNGYDAIIASVAKAAPDASIEGVLVAPMRRDGLELLVGITRDPDWGLIVAVGLGGIWAEALADISLRPAPVSVAQARQMLDELRGAKILAGYRGGPAADILSIAKAIAAASRAALALGPDLEALEINPLFVRGDVIEALDALATWAEPVG